MSEQPRSQQTFDDALQQLYDLAEAYCAENGQYPSLVRVGAAFGRAILMDGASRAQYPDFPVEIDETLEPNEVVMGDEPQPPVEEKRAGPVLGRNRTLAEIVDVVQRFFKDRPYSECYVGITSNTETRLFVEHKVSRLRDVWIALPAVSHAVAREAQRFLLDAGMDGNPEAGDETATFVYAYWKNRFTEP